MNLQVSPIQQVGSELKSGTRYYHGLPSTYEHFSYYVYDGVIDGAHQFVIEGAFRDTMRRILVTPDNLEVKADKMIRINFFKDDVVSKDKDPLEYQRLENLWRNR